MFRRMFGSGGGGGGFEDLFGSFSGGGRRAGRGRLCAARPPETIEVEAYIPFLTLRSAARSGSASAIATSTSKVPAGFEDGKKLRVAGQGDSGEDIVVLDVARRAASLLST